MTDDGDRPPPDHPDFERRSSYDRATRIQHYQGVSYRQWQAEHAYAEASPEAPRTAHAAREWYQREIASGRISMRLDKEGPESSERGEPELTPTAVDDGNP